MTKFKVAIRFYKSDHSEHCTYRLVEAKNFKLAMKKARKTQEEEDLGVCSLIPQNSFHLTPELRDIEIETEVTKQ